MKYRRLNANTCIVAAILFSGHPYIERHYHASLIMLLYIINVYTMSNAHIDVIIPCIWYALVDSVLHVYSSQTGMESSTMVLVLKYFKQCTLSPNKVLLSANKYRKKYLCLYLITCLEIGHICTQVIS